MKFAFLAVSIGLVAWSVKVTPVLRFRQWLNLFAYCLKCSCEDSEGLAGCYTGKNDRLLGRFGPESVYQKT